MGLNGGLISRCLACNLVVDLFRELAHPLPLDFPYDLPQTLAAHLPHGLAQHLPVDLSRHLTQQRPTV
uniref:Uncharacterized protein n=1 Tax=Romanomermis culicivorax TaxID=13658 RepID=A0A915K1C0_ROMCU